MKIIVLVLLATLAAGEIAPLPANRVSVLTRPQVLNIIRAINIVNLDGALGKPINTAKVTELVNERYAELIDPVALTTGQIRYQEAFNFYNRETYAQAIRELYDEGVLTPQLIEGLTSIDIMKSDLRYQKIGP